MNDDLTPQPTRPHGPKLDLVARRAAELGPDDPLVQFGVRMSVALRRAVQQLEAQQLGERLQDLPRTEAQELVAARIGRSPRTIARWWSGPHDD